MRSYILIKNGVPANKAVVIAAHASLAMYLKFKDRPEVAEWLSGPFSKVVCSVTEAEFEKAKETPDNVLLTESTLDNQEVCLAFCPRKDWPKGFKFFRLWS